MEESNQEYCDCPRSTPPGLIAFIATLSAITSAVAGFLAGGQYKAPDAKCQLENSTMALQQQANITQNNANAAFQKRLSDVQERIIKTCVEQKGLPIIMGGNIDCKR